MRIFHNTFRIFLYSGNIQKVSDEKLLIIKCYAQCQKPSPIKITTMTKNIFTLFLIVAAHLVSAQTAQDFADKGYKSMNSGDYPNAIQSFTKAIQLSPTTAWYYHDRAVSYDAIGKYQEAITDFNKALSIEKTADSYNGIGITYTNLEKFTDAISYFNKALALDKNNVETFFNLGYAYGNLKDYDNAIQYFNEALKINPAHARALHGRAITFLTLKKYDEALLDLNSLEKINPNDLEITNYKVTCLYETQKFADAILEYSKLIAANPTDAHLLSQRAASYSFTNQPDEAIKDYSKILDLVKNTNSKFLISNTYYFRGKAYATKENYQSAVKDFDESLKINPTDGTALFYRATCKLQQNQKTDACADYKSAVKNGFTNSFDYKQIMTSNPAYLEKTFGSCK